MEYNYKTKRSFGYLRVAAAVPRVNVADVDFNLKSILEMVHKACEQHVDLLVLPELAVTGYTCGDLFHNSELLNAAQRAIGTLCEETANINMAVVVGAPVLRDGRLYNCAVFIHDGEVKGYVPKTYLPCYKEFYEKRWFASGYPALEEDTFGNNLIFDMGKARVAVEVCEDLWVPIPPSSNAALQGANVIVNLSASNELIGKHANLVRLIQQQSKSCIAAYVYASAGYGESSTDLVFGGNAIIAENGNILCEGDRFSREPQLQVMDIDIEALDNERRVNTSFIDNGDMASEPCETVFTQFDLYSNPEFYAIEPHDMELLHPVKRFPFVPSDKDDLDSRPHKPSRGRYLGWPRLNSGTTGCCRSLRQAWMGPQWHLRHHNAWFWHHRPHLQQCS